MKNSPMHTKQQVHTDFSESTLQLLSALNDFPEEPFNTRVTEGRWSAGEIAEHLIKVETGTLRIFGSDTEPAERAPEQKIGEMKEKLLNFGARLTAYGPIIPDAEPKNKQKVIEKLQDIRQRLASMIEIEDLTQLITVFDHPVFGPLTRVEWLYFNIFHSRRHVRQIEELAVKFNGRR